MACGLEVVLKAARLLREKGNDRIAFLLVGSGALRQSLEKAVRREGIDSVVFTGRCDKREVPAYFSISDACLVHLKDTELFRTVMPSKIFEAAGMAKPIICGVDGYAADLVTRAGAGVCIPPEDHIRLVEALEGLAEDPATARGMGLSGREYVAARFDRDELSARYLDILETVVSSTGSHEQSLRT